MFIKSNYINQVVKIAIIRSCYGKYVSSYFSHIKIKYLTAVSQNLTPILMDLRCF